MAFVQGTGDCYRHALGIAQHIIVPEPQHAVAFRLDKSRTLTIAWAAMLTAVDFDH